MVNQSFRIALLVGALMVLPSMALAQKVVVTPVSYELVWTGNQATGPAERVQQAIQRVARFVGFTVLDHAGASKRCGQATCLEPLAENVGADEAIQIAITDNDGVDFTVDIWFAYHDPISLQSSSSFESILSWIEDQVAIVLQERRDQLDNRPGDALGGEEEPDVDGGSFATVNGSLPPTAFWIALGSGAAFLAATLTLDLVVWRRVETLEDQQPAERDGDYWQTTDRLQVAEIVMLSAAGATLATAGVLAFFTDFSSGSKTSEKNTKVSSTLFPWLSPSGAGFSWSARF